jgi:hypothetical protein
MGIVDRRDIAYKCNKFLISVKAKLCNFGYGRIKDILKEVGDPSKFLEKLRPSETRC